MTNSITNIKEITMIVLAVTTGTTKHYQCRTHIKKPKQIIANNIVYYPIQKTIGIKSKKAM